MRKHRTRTTKPIGDTSRTLQRELGNLTERAPVAWRLKNFLAHGWKWFGQQAILDMTGRLYSTIVLQPKLSGYKFTADYTRLAPEQRTKLQSLLHANVDVRTLVGVFGGQVTDYGVMSTRLITTAGVNFLCDAFQGLATLNNMKFHGFGTGTTAEAIGQTGLVTELTTQYVSDNVRVTGTQAEGASANIYRSVATLSPDSGGTLAITEHGLFDNATVGSGTLWDRSLFTAVNLVAGSDSLQVTYDLTLSAGG